MTRIHVNRQKMATDKKSHSNSRVIGVETTGMRKRYGRRITCHGPVTFIYRPLKPLKCGARAWAETTSKVTVHTR